MIKIPDRSIPVFFQTHTDPICRVFVHADEMKNNRCSNQTSKSDSAIGRKIDKLPCENGSKEKYRSDDRNGISAGIRAE